MQLGLFEFIKLSAKYRDNPFYHYYLKNKQCLDVACGLGALLQRDPVNFMGIDLDVNIVSECHKKGLKVYQGSCTDLSMFSDESMEAVNCSNIIEHLQPGDAVKMLEECARVLKKDGIILIDTPSERNVWSTFSHVKPYPPVSIIKLLDRLTEGFIRSPHGYDKKGHLKTLTVEAVYYKGLGKSRVTFFLYYILFSFTFLSKLFRRPPLCDGYLIVLRKG